MNFYWFILGGCSILYIVFASYSYKLGTKKAFKNLLSFLIPIILSGTAIRIGRVLLPNSISVSYYIAGIGTFLFYTIISPIVKKSGSDRYHKLTLSSRILAVIFGTVQFWLLIAFCLFFINLFYPLNQYTNVFSKLILPIKFLWFFPNI